MSLLDVIEVQSGGQIRRIELHQGDLTELTRDNAVDLLIISAFPDDYAPTLTSLIGSLHQKGVRVRELAKRKATDLRSTHSCWISHPITEQAPGIRFDRILCFEPEVRGDAPEVVGDIFRALAPFVGGDPAVRTAAMPIVAAGDQGYSIATMLPPLVDAAVHWMRVGMPLETLKIFAYADWAAQEARQLFAKLKESLNDGGTGVSEFEYDVFVSYSRDNADAVERIREHLESRHMRLFVDTQQLERGAAWQQRIFEALDSCARLVAIYSPTYITSKVCQDEFNIAWARGRKMDTSIIYPIYWETANLPTYMEMLSYIDCREAQSRRLHIACDELAKCLRG